MQRGGNQELLSVEHAATVLGLSARRVRKLCEDKRLGRRVGRNWVITRAEVDTFAAIPRSPGRTKSAGKRSRSSGGGR